MSEDLSRKARTSQHKKVYQHKKAYKITTFPNKEKQFICPEFNIIYHDTVLQN